MTKCPCKDCENKGCGSYHDECEPYQKFRKGRENNKSEIEDYSKMNGIKKRAYLTKRGYWKVL